MCLWFFFFTAMCQEELTLFTPLFLQKIRRPVLVSAVKFPVKLLSANMQTGLPQVFRILRSSHCEKMFYKKFSQNKTCAGVSFITNRLGVNYNDVMKYSFSAAVIQSWWALHVNLLKIELHRRYFSRNFTTSVEQR